MASVLLISTATSIGGMERVVCSAAHGLAAAGWDVRTVFPECDNADALLAWCADQGVPAEFSSAVTEAAAPHSWRTAAALRRFIREFDPDVVNIHYGDNFLSLWDVLGARLAGPRRTIIASILHPTAWTKGSRRKRAMTAIGGRLVTGVTTISEATREVLAQAGIPARRLEIIPCGVRVPAELADRATSRREFGVDDDAVVVSTLARLVGYKGIDRLIIGLDDPRLVGTVLLVGGDGPDRARLEELAAATKHVRVRFLGRLPEVDPLFAASDVFALPSELEGFGLVYVEAAMYGVPSLACRVGGVPAAIDHGSTGILVEPRDDDGLRDALVDLITDAERRAKLGEAARRRAMTELDEDTMVARFDAVYRRFGAKGP
jgi:glycosyltransferase involved in cell wall biosynthesis